MIGFRSIEHQGHAAARAQRSSGRIQGVEVWADLPNPYPYQSLAFYEYQNGCNAFRRGDVIDLRGDICAPTVNTVKHVSVRRQGSGW